MAEYQKKLNFSLKELVPFRADQLVSEIKSASLEPNVVCHEQGQYVVLRGKLVFCGEYFPQSHERQDDFFAEQNVADVFRNNENGHCTFNYAFPVDITIPQDRILSTDEISIGIDNFDCAIQEDGFINVSAELYVDGVYDREYVEHVRHQNQVDEAIGTEMPAFNLSDEFNSSASSETSHLFAQNHDFTTESSDNHYAGLRAHQADKSAFEQHNHDGQNLNHGMNQNEHNDAVQENKPSYDGQIKYHTTYDYDPWNHNFNNNTYSQTDYYRNPYEATYHGGAETQYYKQPDEKIDNVELNSTDAEDEYVDQYVKFSPMQKPEFIKIDDNDYDIKFIPETSADDTQVSFERENDCKEIVSENKNHTYVDHFESPSESDYVDDSEELQVESVGELIQHEVELEIEKPTGNRTEGYDKVVFPFADVDDTFGKTDEYEFYEEPYVQPKTNQEVPKSDRPEIGSSRVVSDFFNVRGKEEKSSSMKIYIVQRGDSLEQLAEKYSTNVHKIAHLNQLQLNDNISEGQVIYIPE